MQKPKPKSVAVPGARGGSIAKPKARPARITYWDIAGALTFIGIVAALLSDPDQVVPLMEARRSD